MLNATQRRIIAELEHAYPKWQVWVVNRVVGGPLWCARPWGDESGEHLLNENSASDLAEALREAGS